MVRLSMTVGCLFSDARAHRPSQSLAAPCPSAAHLCTFSAWRWPCAQVQAERVMQRPVCTSQLTSILGQVPHVFDDGAHDNLQWKGFNGLFSQDIVINFY